MALDAGTLEVKIVAKTDDATKSVQSFQESIEDISETEDNLVTDTEENTGKVGSFFSGLVEKVSGKSGLGGAFESVLGSLSSVGSVGGAAVMAISAAVTAAIAIINDLKEAADKAAGISDDLITKSAKTGYSVIQLQQMDYAGRFVDTDTDTIISSEKKMVNLMATAADGSETAIAAFDKLGVTVTNADGSLRDSKVVLGEVVTALGEIDDYTTKLALSQDIFGLNNGAAMLPLIKAGWEEYNRLMQEAIDKGRVLTEYEIEELGRRDDLNEEIAATEEAIENKKGAEYAITTGSADLEAELYVKQAELDLLNSATSDFNTQNLLDDVHESLHMVSTKDLPELQTGFANLLAESVNTQQLTLDESMELAQSFNTVGTNMADGTKEGFLASWPAAAQAILANNSDLYNKICDLWGIHSPSRKMMDVSKNIVLGMAKGMDDNAHVAVKSAQGLSENVYLKGMFDTDIINGIDRANASIGMAGISNNSTDNSRNVNVSVNQNNNYGDRSTLMGQHNSNRKLGSMISGAIASAM